MTIVSGIFRDYPAASQAINALESAGITSNQISVVMTDEARGRHFKFHEGTKAEEGVATGAGLGGVLGAIAGLVAGAGAIAIPGLNLIVTGTIVTALAGLGAGATAGGLIGGLVGAGIPEHEAKFFEKEIRGGNVLIAVDARDSEEKKTVKDIFDQFQAERKAA